MPAARRALRLAVLAAAGIGLAWVLSARQPGLAAPDAGALPPLATGADQPMAGNPGGRVTVVEYFDARCPYCRMMEPAMERLARDDPRVRIVFKEWPIFGGISVTAARLALAARYQGRYAEMHRALFALPRAMTEAAIRDAAGRAGVDMARLDRDLAAHAAEIDDALAANAREARALGLRGVPGLVVGPVVLPGAVREADLRALVDRAAAD